jgi:hypothetical protein
MSRIITTCIIILLYLLPFVNYGQIKEPQQLSTTSTDSTLKFNHPDTVKADSTIIQPSIQDDKFKNRISGQTDTAVQIASVPTDTGSPYKPYLHQFRLGIDVLRIGFNLANPQTQGYNFSADYLLRSAWYLVADGGYGFGKIDYENLKYASNSVFIRLGGDKSLLVPVSDNDLDIVFFGFKYGLAYGQRGEVWYKINSLFGAEHTGTVEKDNFFAHWGEMNFGIRTEFWKGIYAGWNFRAKFLLNGKSFGQTVSPSYIAGYGRADKSTIFDFSIFLMYGIQWTK